MRSAVDVNDLVNTLRAIIDRIELEADKTLDGGRANYKKAATEVVEEAYGALSRLRADLDLADRPAHKGES